MTISFDATRCTACGACVDLCPGDLIRLTAGEAVPSVAHQEECWFCGACVHGCPEPNAIIMQLPAALRA